MPTRFYGEGFFTQREGDVAMTIGKILFGGVGLAALAAATPAAAQYYQPYGNAYGYYGNRYGYGMNTQAAVDRCNAAVQNRLSYRTNYNGYYGGYSTGRVLSVTSVDPNRYSVRVRGLATSGRMHNNGLNLFGLLGSNYRADLSFGCTVDYRGRITDIDINRR
jgi:hypothetical protein